DEHAVRIQRVIRREPEIGPGNRRTQRVAGDPDRPYLIRAGMFLASDVTASDPTQRTRLAAFGQQQIAWTQHLDADLAVCGADVGAGPKTRDGDIENEAGISGWGLERGGLVDEGRGG